MPLIIVRNDITKMPVDAIVNAAKESLLGGGGVDGCIHRAAGPELLQECRRLGGCKTGDAKLTKAYRLPCRYIIHTVGPVWNGGKCGEREQLASCYRTSLALAKEHGCETVAFPLISSGVFGYPKDQALRVAVDTISEFLAENDMTVYLVVFSRAAYQIGNKLFADIAAYIDDHYVDAHTDTRRERMRRMGVVESRMLTAYEDAPMAVGGLDEALAHLDAGFSETLLKFIDRSGKKDAEVYKKANVDRKLFSIIRNNPDYKPSKSTAIAFAIALELNLDETRDLIARAEYLFWLLNTEKIKRKIYENATSNMLGAVNARFLADFELVLLSVEDQRKISQFNLLAKRERQLLRMLAEEKEKYYAGVLNQAYKRAKKGK